jgi:hypothetical protein
MPVKDNFARNVLITSFYPSVKATNIEANKYVI